MLHAVYIFVEGNSLRHLETVECYAAGVLQAYSALLGATNFDIFSERWHNPHTSFITPANRAVISGRLPSEFEVREDLVVAGAEYTFSDSRELTPEEKANLDKMMKVFGMVAI